MTSQNPDEGLLDPNIEIAQIISKLGRRRAIFAMLRALMRPKIRPPDASDVMNNHLRRDLGMPPLANPAERWWGARF